MSNTKITHLTYGKPIKVSVEYHDRLTQSALKNNRTLQGEMDARLRASFLADEVVDDSTAIKVDQIHSAVSKVLRILEAKPAP